MAIDALKWISGLLQDREIPFVVCGGLAAIGYGATRPLNDIDLFVPGRHFQSVVSAGAECISKPATHHRGGGWDVEYVQFVYHGTKVEVGNAEGARIFNLASGRWVDLPIDFSRTCRVQVLGIELPLMAAEDLVNYKKILDRPVDRQDIAEVEAHGKPGSGLPTG